MLSLSLCDDCHRGSVGLWFNTMADNNRADGRMAMCVRKGIRVSVRICMHQCIGRAGEHVHEVFQYSEPVRFLKGDSSSTQTEGKSEKYGAPFKIKRRKSLKIHFTCDLNSFLPERYTDIYRAANKISTRILTSHCLFSTLSPIFLF